MTSPGASAGANLAAAVAQHLRDIGHSPMPSLQVLIVPCLQAVDFLTPSYQLHVDNAFLPRYWMISYWLWYALGHDGHDLADILADNEHTSTSVKTSLVSRLVDHKLISQKYVDDSFRPARVDYGNETLWQSLESVFTDPYFAPLMAPDLRNLPPAYIVTAEFDVLRDDGMIYAKRLNNDGVGVVHRHYDQTYHAVLSDWTKGVRVSKLALADLLEFLAGQL